jgi:phosphate transport system permease protein
LGDTFTESTPAPNEPGGGLANAIVGSLIMVLLGTFLGTPIGIFAGIYLAEYGQRGWLGNVTRFINDILLSAPSIVVGLFIYAVVVAQVKTFSAYAGILALALIVIPVVVRTTENMLLLIPSSLREAAFALGSPKWIVISRVTLRAATAGVVTGVLLALARVAGETAPLALHGAVEPVLQPEPGRPDGEPAGHHLQVCDEPIQELAGPGLGGCLPDHDGRADPECLGARTLPQEGLSSMDAQTAVTPEESSTK